MSDSYQLVETLLQQQLENGDVLCNLCQWRCRLQHGQRGFCQAHVNRDGRLYNLSYGIVSAIEVESIRNKPVYHFKPDSTVMSIGSFGCNFRCKGCHNLEISWGVEALDKLAKGSSTEVWVTAEKMVETALKCGVDGIAFTYSEPAVWLEYVLDVSRLARQVGLFTVYVSNSFVTDEALEVMAPYIDVLCSDIKSLSDSFYHDICPVSHVAQVLGSIKKAQELGIHIETRTNVIPGKNDSEHELRRVAEWIHDNLGAASPWHITKFFPAYKLSHLPPTGDAIINTAVDNARKVGLQNVYGHTDISCDCATQNAAVSDWIDLDAEALNTVKKCSASCCGEEGILVKKFERAQGLID
ncbi:MAG: AmmeMemoRadiSam system radical SAM enzyme [Gammaproteobacteria bacterium]|nr:AmmeMemoRadiSam system radical SAM enzyme [Gammaproteobacteria bacterium]